MVHDLDGVTVHRARYAPDRHEVLAYRGGGHAKLQARWHAALLIPMLVSLWWTTWRTVRRTKPDAVHAHFLIPGGLVAALVPRGRGASRARLVMTFHGNDAVLAAKKPVRPVARWIARRADVVAAVSEPLAASVASVVGLPVAQVAIAPMPLAKELHPVTPRLRPDARALRVLGAGRASREKGFDVLVDALRDSRLAAMTTTLFIDGPESDALRQQAAALGERVVVRGAVAHAELMDEMRAHDVVVLPSRSEGLGMLGVEALALGKHIIASNVGGLPSLIGDPTDGTLVPPDNAHALADALAALIDTNPLPSPIATAAEHLRPTVVASTHRTMYDPER
jgi:glycosyltransferase involved in cell wall biosynthesis